MLKNCWFNGELMPVADAKVSVLDHGLLYGDGIFEGLRCYHGIIFKAEEHIDRLAHSAKAILLDIPYSKAELLTAMDAAVAGAGMPDCYIRLVVTRGVGKLGINPDSCERPSVFIIADKLEMISAEKRQQGITLVTASTRRLPVDGLDPRVKSLNYLNHIQARLEANIANADDAILLNASGHVTEATVANLFIASNGELLTPPVADGALDGITRQSVIDAAAIAGITVSERSLTRYDIYNADECFLTGSGAELIPARSLDGRRIGSSDRPLFKQVQQGFWQIVEQECSPEVITAS